MQVDSHTQYLDMSSALLAFYPEVEGTPCAPGGRNFAVIVPHDRLVWI